MFSRFNAGLQEKIRYYRKEMLTCHVASSRHYGNERETGPS